MEFILYLPSSQVSIGEDEALNVNANANNTITATLTTRFDIFSKSISSLVFASYYTSLLYSTYCTLPTSLLLSLSSHPPTRSNRKKPLNPQLPFPAHKPNTMASLKPPLDYKIDDLSPAITQAAVHAHPTAHSPDLVKHTILEICNSLLALNSQTRLWKTPPANPYAVSLSTLHNRLLTGKPAPNLAANADASDPASSPRTRLLTAPDPQPELEPETEAADMSTRALEHFEDLYYVLLCEIRAIHHILLVRVNNGWYVRTDRICDNGPAIEEVYGLLCGYWDGLNEVGLVKALDESVRVGSMRRVKVQVQCGGDSVVGVVETGRGSADGDGDESGARGGGEGDEGVREVRGLEWIGAWPANMISPWLEEKYRGLLLMEKRRDEGGDGGEIMNSDTLQESERTDG